MGMERFRFGVSSRLLVGVLLLSLLTVVAAIGSVVVLRGFHSDYGETAERLVPRMSLAARLQNQAESTLADVGAMILAEGQFRRESLHFRVQDRLRDTEDLIAALSRSGLAEARHETLDRSVRHLRVALADLDAAIEARINASERLDRRARQVRAVSERVDSRGGRLVSVLSGESAVVLDGDGTFTLRDPERADLEATAYLRAYARPLDAWLQAFSDVSTRTLDMVFAHSPEVLDAGEHFAEGRIADLRYGLHSLPSVVVDELGPDLNELERYTVGEDALIGARRALLEQRAAADAAYAAGRFQADRLSAAVQDLITGTVLDVRARNAEFAQRLDRLTLFAALVMLLSLAAAAGVTLYVHRGIMLRLTRLQETMRVYLAGDTPEISDRQHDEIGDIGKALTYFMEEISRREQRLEELAATDVLTGVNNRRQFFAIAEGVLEQARDKGHACGLLLVDIDHFKRINDEYGHANGDAALRALAAVCQEVLRDEDVFGRLGGEEFAAVLPDANLGAARVVAERLCDRVRERPLAVGNLELSLTVSVGVTELHPADRDLDALLYRADRALYDAKGDGRDQVCVCQPATRPVPDSGRRAGST